MKEKLLTTQDNGCQQFFIKYGLELERGYYELLHKNLCSAKKIFQNIQENDIRAHWGNIITSMAEGNLIGYPSYFELRNFYEVDLQLLFTHYLGEYIEEICKFSDWLYKINPEIYKYTGRSFLKNGYTDIGLYFLKKGKEQYFNDPELHFLLGEYHFENNDYSAAFNDLQTCLRILPDYYPALKLKQEIDKTL